MRILVVGVSGAGKTTLAKRLSLFYESPHIEVDDLYWSSSSQQDFHEKLEFALRGEKWIVEGHFLKIGEILLPLVDLVILLKTPPCKCFFRVFKRELRGLVLEGNKRVHWQRLIFNFKNGFRLQKNLKNQKALLAKKNFILVRSQQKEAFEEDLGACCKFDGRGTPPMGPESVQEPSELVEVYRNEQ